jgi:hypothetical protein
MDKKSVEEIAKIIERKMTMIILEELPTPSCNLKRQHNDWKIEQVYRILRDRLTSKIRK